MATQMIFKNETGMEQIFYDTVLNPIKVKPEETYVLDPDRHWDRWKPTAASWIAEALRTKLREL
jgi:hypothetical protein